MFGRSVKIFAFVALSTCIVGITSQIPVNEQRPKMKGYVPPTDEERLYHPLHPLKGSKQRSDIVLPSTFDAAQKWPACTSISTIRDQGQCGTCYAVSAASVIADRICIASAGGNTDFISGSHAAGCTYPKQTPMERCTEGGDQGDVFRFAALSGIASGGEYQSNVGCYPYTVGREKVEQICPTGCSTSVSQLDVQGHTIDSYWQSTLPKGYSDDDINKQVLLMKREIYQYGPITAGIFTNGTAALNYIDALDKWKDPAAPYSVLPNFKGNTDHAVRLTGWGQTDDDTNYWIVANSWGVNVGVKGYQYVKMGQNIAGIESDVSAPFVDISKVISCQTSTFCSAPISQAVTMDPSNSNSDTFLFQGNCLLKINKNSNGISANGAAVPIGKLILAAPSAPITGYSFSDSGVNLFNPTGEAGLSCALADKSSKYTCQRGTFTSSSKNKPTAVFIDQNGVQNRYSYDADQDYFFLAIGSSMRASSVGQAQTLFTDVGMTTINAFLDVDGTKFYVFGTDANKQPLVGVMTYPTDNTVTWATQPGNNVMSCNA